MSSYGKLFKVTTYGESHGTSVGVIIEGFPSNIIIDRDYIQYQLNRRRPGTSSINTTRSEDDIVEIHSGEENNYSLGTPILLLIKNKDFKKVDYNKISEIPRPGHADLTYLAKYGIKTMSGGGRSSARETTARVAAGALAETILIQKYNVNIFSFVKSVGTIQVSDNEINKFILSKEINKKIVDEIGSFEIYIVEDKIKEDCLDNKSLDIIFYNKYLNTLYFYDNNELVEKNATTNVKISEYQMLVIDYTQDINHSIIISLYSNNKKINFIYKEFSNIRCLSPIYGVNMIIEIFKCKANKDSLGGIVTCVIQNIPRSLGEPCFDKLEAELAKGMLSIPSTKGFEIGSGFEGTKLTGSQHNDLFIHDSKESPYTKDQSLSLVEIPIKQKTNNCGGTLGGISTGGNIYFSTAFKPVSTISKEQITSDYKGEEKILENEGRHDPCVVNRAIPIVESMASITILDMVLQQNSRIFN